MLRLAHESTAKRAGALIAPVLWPPVQRALRPPATGPRTCIVPIAAKPSSASRKRVQIQKNEEGPSGVTLRCQGRRPRAFGQLPLPRHRSRVSGRPIGLAVKPSNR
eukprot:357568-Chlamydomonas_euryale.AAC.4